MGREGGGCMQIPESAAFVVERLRAAGYEARAVGGCVRDMLMGTVPHDWDLCTNAGPEEMLACFDGLRVITTGLAHGTVTVLSGGEPVEVTAYRAESAYSDHRHPDRVRFVRRIEDDLSRRDFTVNAMAWDPETGLIDLFDGRGDIERQLIRCVGVAGERFSEDALRILRALRFAARLGFAIEEETARAIHERKELLKRISAERVFAELKGLLMGKDAAKILTEFDDVIQVVLPGAVPFGADAPEDMEIRLALLVKAAGAEALKGLRCDNATRKAAAELLEAPAVRTPEEMRKLAARYGKERARQAVWMQGGDRALLEETLENSPCLSLAELAVNGGDLLALGLSAGPALGETLQELLGLVLEEKLPNEKEALLRYVKTGETRPEKKEPGQTGGLAIGMCLGMSFGMMIGTVMGNTALGMCLGLSVGMCLGLALGGRKK